MTSHTVKGENQRRQIMDTAIRLFARKGYSATGMREISLEAGVNLAMINYYFGSKANLLKKIMEDFFDRFQAIIKRSFDQELTVQNLEEIIRSYVKDLTILCRDNTDLMKVTVTEFPIDIPEIAEFKGQQMKNIINELLVYKIIPVLEKQSNQRFIPSISGPALGGMIVMHFLLRPIVESLFCYKFENDFYDYFPDYISSIFLFGTIGDKAARLGVQG